MNVFLSVLFLLVSVLVTQLFYKRAQNTRLIDKPNERSLHSNPTVRGGGLVFIGLFLFAMPFICYFQHNPIADFFIFSISILLLAFVGFMDDLYQLSAKIRFLIQSIIAVLIALFLRPEVLNLGFFVLINPYLVMTFLFFAVIWAINHFNFMDGIDGFCASQAIFLLFAYFLLFRECNALIYQDFCLVLILSLIGFLIFNFPPAKLFMGDIGSASLGLITFGMAVIAQQKYQIPILYWFIFNGLFLFDASITLLRRVINKEKWFVAHRKHAYQRLKQFGINTRFILLGQIVINGSFLIGFFLFQNNQLSLSMFLSFVTALMLILYGVIEKLFPMYQK